ncbi:hypothetical protein GC163_18220 [bacterium]|nr:hypothetical protein [bacterium]
MMHRFGKWIAVWSLCFGGALPLLAQDEQAEEAGIEYPLQVIHCSGVDRVQGKADALFAAAERPELSDVLQNFLDETLRGMKGVDRTRPFGMMLYLKPGLTPGIAAVTYFPVESLDEFVQFLAGKSGVSKSVSSKNDRYEITDVDWGPDLVVQQIGDYAYMTALDDALELDRKFPHPERMVRKLTSRYDVAYSLLIKNVPIATRTLFLEFFKNQALASLQQRDDEPEAPYRIRRANGEAMIDLLDMVVRQGEDFTVGAFADPDQQTGYVELELNGTKDSGLSKFFGELAGRRSYFDAAVEQSATLSVNTSVQLDEKRRAPFVEMFRLATTIIEAELTKRGENAASTAQIAPFFSSLLQSAQIGHLDLFLQISGEEALDYRMLGGARIYGAENLPEQFAELLKFGKETVSKTAPGAGGKHLQEFELAQSTVAGFPVHVLPVPAEGDVLAMTMFGNAPQLYLCATSEAIWFAVGQESALKQLESSIKLVTSEPDPNQPKRPAFPFLLTTHASQWVNVAMATGVDPGEDAYTESSLTAFEPDTDEFRLTARPTERGVRVRAEMQPSYFRWIGMLIGNTIDEGLSREQQREERRQRREQQKAAPTIK